MPTTEIFENEEATQLLNYFVAYRKLQSKVEYIKCISKLNNEINIKQTQPTTENLTITPQIENQAQIELPTAPEK